MALPSKPSNFSVTIWISQPPSEGIVEMIGYFSLICCNSVDFRAVVQGGMEEDTIYTLTKQESQLLSGYREITAEEQNNILSYVNFLKDHQAK